MPPLSRARIALGLFAALACSSCSSDGMNPVTGSVTHNGQPAVGATVMFFPEGAKGLNVVPSTGVVGADGTFTLSTGGKAGAPVGRYVSSLSTSAERRTISRQRPRYVQRAIQRRQ